METFDNFQSAFDYCRERGNPVIVKIDGDGKFKLYPSGKATRLTTIPETSGMIDDRDYDELIKSYLPAARAAGLTRADVELALSIACRFLERCESCCHSRAPHDAVEVAKDQGRLDIYRRSCSFRRPTGNGCSHWERLEVPEPEEVVA